MEHIELVLCYDMLKFFHHHSGCWSVFKVVPCALCTYGVVCIWGLGPHITARISDIDIPSLTLFLLYSSISRHPYENMSTGVDRFVAMNISGALYDNVPAP